MAFFLQRKRCEIRVKFVGLKFTAPPSCYLAWLNRERHTGTRFFYFPYPAGPLCWCASQPSLQTDRCSGLRRWMGVQRWNLSEVEKNKGRRRSPSPPPRYGLTWGFYWDDAEIHFRTLHYFTADLKLLGTIGGGDENAISGFVKELWGALVCCHDNLAASFPCGGVSGPLQPLTWTSWSLFLWTQNQLCWHLFTKI